MMSVRRHKAEFRFQKSGIHRICAALKPAYAQRVHLRAGFKGSSVTANLTGECLLSVFQ